MASAVDHVYYISMGPEAADSNDGLSPDAPFKTIQRALIALGYTTDSKFSFPVTMISGTTVTFGTTVTLPAGIPVCFAVQPDTYYYLASAVNASTTGTLTSSFTGSFGAGPTTVSPGVGNQGSIVLFAGTFPAPRGGLVLGPRQSIEGVGATASNIQGPSGTGGNGNPVLCLTGSRSGARNLFVTVDNETSDAVGVRVGLLWGYEGTNPNVYTGTNEDSYLQNIYVSMGGKGTSICFGIGDNTTGDVSDVTIIGCTANGPYSSSENDTIVGFYMGGGAGNVLDISVHGGVANGCDYGVVVSGGASTFWGFNFVYSSKADIWLKSDAVGNVSFHGGRSENAGRFLISDFFAGYQSAKVQDYTVVALRNTDGQGIQLIGSGIVLENIAFFGLYCPQYIYIPTNADSDYPYRFDFANIFCDHPFPLQSPWTRDNQIFATRALGFVGDAAFEMWSRCTTSDHRVKRKNVTPTSNAGWIVDPIFFDAYDVRLSSKAGTLTLRDGSIGKLITVTFEQDGVGGWAYTWPAKCAWSGGNVPANVTTPRNRQSCTFRYNGRYWEQTGPITNVLPPAVAATPIADNFGKQVLGGISYWLNQPDTTGTETRWEHVPGGGSLGINNTSLDGGLSACVTLCLGYIGDNETNDGTGLLDGLGPGAAAVIETGMATQATGISATFTWQKYEGIICRYRDDQNFVVFAVGDTVIQCLGFSLGQQLLDHPFPHGVKMLAGSKHTLLVKCTATDFLVSLDDAPPHTFTPSAAELPTFPNFRDFTKHGILSTHRMATFTNFTVS
jgi:hypothetical protein